ncbi:hypothetical protein LMH73_009350 [Vibrio splendidus]|nr:hypothetical protein [Vibrio splendidus]MCC4881863.1 hypothetical protein [Vibrio splendidus]
MKILQVSKNQATWLDLSAIQVKSILNMFMVNDEPLVGSFSPELTDIVNFARNNDYTHIKLFISDESKYVVDGFPMVQDNDITLTKDRAVELVNVISNSNYQLARFADTIFDSKEDALAFIASDEYSESEGIEVVFTCKNEQTDSASASYKNERWYLVDHAHGGTTTSHTHLEAALCRLVEGINSDEEYCPELFQTL